jgi:hypothetical protein
MAIRNMMNDPAIAKEETSMPKIPSKGLPINKKANRMKNDTRVTFPDLTLPDLDLIPIMIGIEPGISMMAKRTIKAARISIKLKCIAEYFTANLVRLLTIKTPFL